MTQPWVKRVFDIGLASAAIAATAPLMLATAAALRADSPGPILFRQTRVGRSFRDFRILKFRTMTADASTRGPQITAGNDVRVTRVGRILRATKLDELPQLWNVLRGDMSLVGPRPEVPKYVEQFRADFEEILSVRPGITDLASLEFRHEQELLAKYADPEAGYIEEILPAKIKLAREYVRQASLRLDLAILGRTLRKVILG